MKLGRWFRSGALVTVLWILGMAPLRTPWVSASEYVVRSGDTLSGIAQRELGSAQRWREIAERNSLRDPYLLKFGQILNLPEKPSREVVEVPPAEVLPVRSPPEDVAPADPFSNIFSAGVWVWLLVYLPLIFVGMFTSIWLGCWFSLVDASWGQCIRLTGWICGVFFFIVGMSFLLHHLAFADIAWRFFFFMWLVYNLGMIVLTKFMLECPWRSVVTITVMSQTCLQILIGILFLISMTFPSWRGGEAVVDVNDGILRAVFGSAYDART